MKIAQVSSLMEAVPPKLYGGTERVVAYLTDELVELGHEVTLFASADSHTKAVLEPGCPRALRLDPAISDYLAPHVVMLETLARRAHEFDIIHLHIDYLGFSLLRRTGVPFVTTLHGRMDLPELRAIYRAFPDVPVVSISNAQRVRCPMRTTPQRSLTAYPGSNSCLAPATVITWPSSAGFRRRRRPMPQYASRAPRE